MDTLLLDEFLNYNPVFDENPQWLVDKIKKMAWEYLPKDKLAEIQRAYEFAYAAHKLTAPRHSGEPYITHPVLTTIYLMKIKPDLSSIQAALLHDLIEDTTITYEDIKDSFWEDVANLCDGMVKVSKVRYKWEDRQLETLKKTFIAMCKDLRVIFIRFADRIHNLQTLQFHPKPEKRTRIAYETLKIYVPIAERLWLSVFQWYLENWCFRILNPLEFNRIFNYIKKNYPNPTEYITQGCSKITDILKTHSIEDCEVRWRIKSPYRIYRKLVKYNSKDISKIMDIIAFRVVTSSVESCYSVLWFIHNEFTPIINKIKDYIALPKHNWYKSLHTTILWFFNFPVEVQIRTKEMDNFAQFWAAAHFLYTWWKGNLPQQQTQWIQNLQEIVKNYQEEKDKEKFKKDLQIEILDKDIFIYTPRWDIIQMPEWSTVLDFAFRIHSDIWLKFKNAIVNRKIVPIDYKLSTSDIVEIQTFKNKYTASSGWLDILYTPSARNKLSKYLKQIEREIYLAQAISILNIKLESYGLPLFGSKWDQISKKYKDDDMNDILFKIYEKQISPTKIIKDTYKDLTKDISIVADQTEPQLESKVANIIVDIDKVLDYALCPECTPTIKDKIIARVWKDWIKVHTLECKALDNISYDKLIEAHWEGWKPVKYIVRFEIEVNDKPWVLLQILSIFYEFNVNLYNIEVTKSSDGRTIDVIDLEFVNPSKIYYVLKELKNRENLLKVLSTKIS